MVTETRKMPLTVYGLLARRHNVANTNYVQEIVNGKRKAIRGKAAAILSDWNKLKDSFEDWITEYKADGTMIVEMEDIRVSIYVQHGIGRLYKEGELEEELDVKNMSLRGFEDLLRDIRIKYNK